jgi:hypothetical protein
VDLCGSADKIFEISSKLIQNETEGKHATDRARRKVFRQTLSPDLIDRSFIAGNGFGQLVDALGRLAGGQGLRGSA